MNEEAKSAVFGLNWLQEAKVTDEVTPGSYNAEQEVWTTTDGQVLAAGSDLRTRFYTSYYTINYTTVVQGSAILCDNHCEAACDAGAA